CKDVGFKHLLADVPFFSRALLPPLLTVAWWNVQSKHARMLFGVATVIALFFSVWAIGQWLNAQFGWGIALFRFVGPPDSGPARIYHERPLPLAWQLAPWFVSGLMVLRVAPHFPGPVGRRFLAVSLPLALVAELGTGSRAFVAIVALALVAHLG